MSEDKTSKKARLLLAALLIIWVGVTANAVLDLEEEGADVCGRLAHTVEKYPGEARPCAVSTFDTDGKHLHTIRAHFDDEQLMLAEFDDDGDGVTDKSLDCSWSGRVTMPLMHTGKWLGVAVSKEMSKGNPALDFVERRSEADGEHTVVFYEAPHDRDGPAHRRRDRRNAADQLVERRFFHGSFEPPIRTMVLTYDDKGRVKTVHRRTEMPPSESVTRLRYDCSTPSR